MYNYYKRDIHFLVNYCFCWLKITFKCIEFYINNLSVYLFTMIVKLLISGEKDLLIIVKQVFT